MAPVSIKQLWSGALIARERGARRAWWGRYGSPGARACAQAGRRG